MLYRKITSYIEDYLKSDNDKILILEGARQIGKSFSIREVGTRLYPNFVEINFVEDDEGEQLFKNIHKKEDFYLTLSMVAGDKLNNRDDTLVFLDEIQHYPQYLTMLKFLREDNRYRYIASGSLLGITLKDTTSIPVGSITIKEVRALLGVKKGQADAAIGKLMQQCRVITGAIERVYRGPEQVYNGWQVSYFCTPESLFEDFTSLRTDRTPEESLEFLVDHITKLTDGTATRKQVLKVLK
jgi:predicted AAA+ superfamily ATPase